MSFKETFNKSVDFIDGHRKSIVTASLSMLGVILLMIIFFISSDELSIGKETDELLNSIETRKYSNAVNYYQKLERNFSDAKMKRFNKSISKKINTLLLNNGDKYINDQISKEHYIGLINTINSLENITLDVDKIITQAKRVDEMYSAENLSYDIAISYMNTISGVNRIGDALDIYKQNIKVINQSREIYKEGLKNQKEKKYYQAIKSYDKVLKEDKKYYDLAQKYKKQCVEDMYKYYIDASKEQNNQGNYEEALQYMEYLKEYYIDDETVQTLEKEYQTNLSLYTLTPEDIINIIVKKSGMNKERLSINSFQQMIDDDKYYYVEVYEYDKLIDEILINAKTKVMYSYKDKNKDYNVTYSDGYFKILDDGAIAFTISEDEAKFTLENKLEEKNNKYKDISMVDKEKALKYINNISDAETFLNKNDMYYYAVVNKGIFKKKEVYLIDMYKKKVYFCDENKIENY